MNINRPGATMIVSGDEYDIVIESYPCNAGTNFITINVEKIIYDEIFDEHMITGDMPYIDFVITSNYDFYNDFSYRDEFDIIKCKNNTTETCLGPDKDNFYVFITKHTNGKVYDKFGITKLIETKAKEIYDFIRGEFLLL